MGVDLSLMPLIGQNFWTSHELILLERDRDLWEEFIKVRAIEIPQPLSCFVSILENKERGYGYLSDDPYGNPLKFTTAKELKKLRTHKNVQCHWKNRAIWAYLEHIPDDWQIILYWH